MFQVYTYVCALQEAHVVFQLNTCMLVPQVNVYVCAHGCTSARAACTVSVVFIRVFSTCTHTCVSELDMSVCTAHVTARLRSHTCVHARARPRPLSHALAQPQFLRGAEALSATATHVQQRNACRVHDCIILIHPC